MWPDDRVLALFGIQLPIIQAPMAGSVTSEMVVAVSEFGGLGSMTRCALVIELHPEVVSFHFGLPDENLLAPVRGAGARIVSSATSVDEARWLEDQGCDAIVAQGYEAGGH